MPFNDPRDTFVPSPGSGKRAQRHKQERMFDGRKRRMTARQKLLASLPDTPRTDPVAYGSRVKPIDSAQSIGTFARQSMLVTYRQSPGPRKTQDQRNGRVRIIRP
jgi:hypothetical protein